MIFNPVARSSSFIKDGLCDPRCLILPCAPDTMWALIQPPGGVPPDMPEVAVRESGGYIRVSVEDVVQEWLRTWRLPVLPGATRPVGLEHPKQLCMSAGRRHAPATKSPSAKTGPGTEHRVPR